MRTHRSLLCRVSLLAAALGGLIARPSPAPAAAQASPAGYASPTAAGFHHCVLIYDRDTRGPGDLAHYVAHTGPGKPEWLFDAFLFLIQGSARGIRTEYGETQKVDWEYQMDRWFAPGRDLAALDTALSQAEARLGPLPEKRRVILSIPYPNPLVTHFGDVNGDGIDEDLSTPEGRRAVLAWYMDAAKRRFEAAGYRHLSLWGFYWMREDMDRGDDATMRVASDLAHARGARLLWIPYYRSPGWDTARKAGFDAVIMQPNYAFSTWQHGGRAGRGRLAATAQLARENGLGVEIEGWNLPGNAEDRRVFLQYLAEGTRFGYQKAIAGYFLSTDLVEQIATSKDPDVRRTYDALADYVAGRPVRDPDPKLAWKWSKPSDGARVAEARASGRVSALDILLKETADRPWEGSVEVAVRKPGAAVFAPAAWALRTAGDPITGIWQDLRIPVEQDASALRVTFRPDPGSPPLRVAMMTTDPSGPHRITHAARFAPYRMSDAPPGQYPDSGHELTDGIIPEGGFTSGQSVGWSNGRAMAVQFDLGRAVPVEKIEVHCQGGGSAAINWPGQAMALLTTEAPSPVGFSGFGPLPTGLVRLSGSPVTVDRKRSETDEDGHITFAPPVPTRARYVSVLLDGNGWLMLSEVRIFANGKNVAPDATYTLRPLPSGGGDTPYADDGILLTDGVVAQGFVAGEIVGWQGSSPRDVVVDMGATKPVRQVTVWSLRGGQHDITGPKEVRVDVSADGTAWTPLGLAMGPAGPEDGASCVAAPYRLDAPANTSARYVRARVTAGRGWAMLSEVAVEE